MKKADQTIYNGRLFLIPSPITSDGGWKFSAAIEAAIKSSSTILCERVRTTRRLIKYMFTQSEFDKLDFVEMDKHGNLDYIDQILDTLRSGHHVSLLSEAGVPCIADPGQEVVNLAHQKNISVEPFPGPCSFIMALMASGLNGQAFQFHGYLDRDQEKLQKQLRSINKTVLREGSSQLFMETPYRNQRLFNRVLQEISDDLYLNVSMDINGSNQMIKTQTISNWKKQGYIFSEKQPAVFIVGRI